MKIFRDFWKNASFAYSCAPFLSSSRLPEHSWYKVLINLIKFLTLREKWEICKHCFCRHHLLPSPVFVFVFEGTIYSHLLYLYLYLQAPSTPLSCICMHFCKTVYSTLLYLYLYLHLQATSTPLSCICICICISICRHSLLPSPGPTLPILGHFHFLLTGFVCSLESFEKELEPLYQILNNQEWHQRPSKPALGLVQAAQQGRSSKD